MAWVGRARLSQLESKQVSKVPWPFLPRFVPAPGSWVPVVPPAQSGSRGCEPGTRNIRSGSSFRHFVRGRTGAEDTESLLMHIKTAAHAAIQSSTNLLCMCIAAKVVGKACLWTSGLWSITCPKFQ